MAKHDMAERKHWRDMSDDDRDAVVMNLMTRVALSEKRIDALESRVNDLESRFPGNSYLDWETLRDDWLNPLKQRVEMLESRSPGNAYHGGIISDGDPPPFSADLGNELQVDAPKLHDEAVRCDAVLVDYLNEKLELYEHARRQLPRDIGAWCIGCPHFDACSNHENWCNPVKWLIEHDGQDSRIDALEQELDAVAGYVQKMLTRGAPVVGRYVLHLLGRLEEANE